MTSKLITDTIYKQTALRNKFGLAVKSFIFTMNEMDEEKYIAHLRRAKDFKITIVDISILRDSNKVKEILLS